MKIVIKIEDQVCSFELAKRLKHLRVPYESIIYWRVSNFVNDGKAQEPFLVSDAFGKEAGIHIAPNMTDYPAYTVAELGYLLQNAGGQSRKTHSGWRCECEMSLFHFFGDTEADARAKMLIHILEKNKEFKL